MAINQSDVTAYTGNKKGMLRLESKQEAGGEGGVRTHGCVL